MTNKILIAYHYFAHYRLPIIMELAKDKQIVCTFLSGTTTNNDIQIINSTMVDDLDVRWRTVDNFWFFKKKLLWQTGIIRECILGKYDLIILLGNPYFLSTWFAALLSRLLGKPVYFWAHGTVRNKKRDLLKIGFFRLANGLFLYGNWAKNRLTELGFNPNNLHVIYNSLNYSAQLEIRNHLRPDVLDSKKKQLFENSGLPVLLFIGRLTKKKKLDQLITVCEQMHSHGMPANVLFVGTGEDQSRLMELALSKGLCRYVNFYGESYDEQELAPLIAMSDVCVSPGDVGLTAIHSLTYGTPVITHDNPFEQGPEFEAITPGVTGMLFKYGDIHSLVETVVRWLKSNAGKREQVRMKCYEIIDQYYNPAYQAKVITSVLNYID